MHKLIDSNLVHFFEDETKMKILIVIIIIILYLFSADLKWFRGDEELTDSVTIKGEDETYSKSELTITVNRSVILTIFLP